MSSSGIYAHETELADWVEMLMRWMGTKRLHEDDTASVFNISVWTDFSLEYPSTALDMKKWLEARHNYIAEDDPEDRAGSPRDE